jgi:hypothetical protein
MEIFDGGYYWNNMKWEDLPSRGAWFGNLFYLNFKKGIDALNFDMAGNCPQVSPLGGGRSADWP